MLWNPHGNRKSLVDEDQLTPLDVLTHQKQVLCSTQPSCRRASVLPISIPSSATFPPFRLRGFRTSNIEPHRARNLPSGFHPPQLPFISVRHFSLRHRTAFALDTSSRDFVRQLAPQRNSTKRGRPSVYVHVQLRDGDLQSEVRESLKILFHILRDSAEVEVGLESNSVDRYT